MLRFDKTLPILDSEQKQIVEDKTGLTLGIVIVRALLLDRVDEHTQRSMSGGDKARQFQLAMRVQGAQDVFEITIEEAATIKACVALFPPVYVGRVYEAMDHPLPEAVKAERQDPA